MGTVSLANKNYKLLFCSHFIPENTPFFCLQEMLLLSLYLALEVIQCKDVIQ